jgi:hypothetical protein
VNLARVVTKQASRGWRVVASQLMRNPVRQQYVAAACIACTFLIPLSA